MSITVANDVAFVRFRAPDLDRMADYMTDFGMIRAESATPEHLFMRGYGAASFLHVTELGDPAFLGFGLRVADGEALARLARSERSAVQPLQSPGGGEGVRLVDPDGFRVEAVAGQATGAPQPLPPIFAWNHGCQYPRQRMRRSTPSGPSHVLRLGHVVLGVRDFPASERWYKERFGFLTSDAIHDAAGAPVGAFLRCDLGAETTDHHSLFLLQLPQAPQFLHAAFEVLDLDDLQAGHAHLASKHPGGHFWGIGRHILGSQVFDYWRDPWGHQVEHWTDGDKLDADFVAGRHEFPVLMQTQWGPEFPGVEG